MIVAICHLEVWLPPGNSESQSVRNRRQRVGIQGWLFEQILYGYDYSISFIHYIFSAFLMGELQISLYYYF